MKQRIDFLITNPHHHVAMVLPIIRVLQGRGVAVRVISLCEFRRMTTPVAVFAEAGIPLRQLPGFKQKNLKASTGRKALGKSTSPLRQMVRYIAWHLMLKKAWRALFRDGQTRSVFLLNDTAYPNNHIVSFLRKRSIPFDLLPEGIRFELPNEVETGSFGASGARYIFAWGDSSAAYFRPLIKANTRIVSSGCPRYDTIIGENYEESIKVIKEKYGSPKFVLGFFSNPIDDQGFCSHDEKIELVESFIQRALPAIKAHGGEVWIKLHPRESEADILQIIAHNQWTSEEVKMVNGDIFALLKFVNVSVVLASTVGLESLLMGTPLGVLSIPGHGFTFDYVQRKAAAGLDMADDAFQNELAALLMSSVLPANAKQYLDNSISHIGSSMNVIAQHLVEANG